MATPSTLTRLKATIQFYRHGFKSLRHRIETKKAPFVWPAWFTNNPQWQLIDYQTYVQEGFTMNPVLYAAIMYKVRAITITPLRAYKGTPEEPNLLPADAPLQELCRRPNRFQSWSEFMGLADACLNLAGNCYILFERVKDEVVGMYVMRPDRIFIIPARNKKELIGFYYVPEGKSWQDGEPYLAQDVMHVKLPNPADPLDGMGYGISPVSPSAQAINVDNDLTRFFRLFFRNGAMPQGILSFDTPMEADEAAEARRRFMEHVGGMEEWVGPAVLDQGGKYERTGLTFHEMNTAAIDGRNESRIVSPLGVPLNLIESRPELVQSTYSNKATDREMFWEDTMEPELLWFECEFQYYLQGTKGEFVMFDMSRSPAAQKRRSQRVTEYHNAYKEKAVTIDEYRAALDPQLGPAPDELKKPEPVQVIVPPPTTEEMPEVVEQTEEVVINGNGKGYRFGRN